MNGETLVGPEDGLLTLSAAGLFLLRTLDADRAGDGGIVGEEDTLLFPCCGFVIYPGVSHCHIQGCPNGVDVTVTTDGDVIRFTRGTVTAATSRAQWRESVLGFVDEVGSFYASSLRRAPIDDAFEAEGWQQFWDEWHMRIRRLSA